MKAFKYVSNAKWQGLTTINLRGKSYFCIKCQALKGVKFSISSVLGLLESKRKTYFKFLVVKNLKNIFLPSFLSYYYLVGNDKKRGNSKKTIINFSKLKEDMQNTGFLISLYYFSSYLLFFLNGIIVN